MPDIEQELDELEEEIESKKARLARNKGSMETLNKQLKNELDIKSIEGAKEEIEKLGNTLNTIKKRIGVSFNKLKDNYTW